MAGRRCIEPAANIAQRARVRPRRRRWSVAVPIYNVEQYLAEALDSFLAQSYDDLEIVMVDDGSTDTSHPVVEDYAGGHPNVHAIATENHRQHAGAAENQPGRGA
jgi:glycosyltransferase involved in cell wall biosynthesis